MDYIPCNFVFYVNFVLQPEMSPPSFLVTTCSSFKNIENAALSVKIPSILLGT